MNREIVERTLKLAKARMILLEYVCANIPSDPDDIDMEYIDEVVLTDINRTIMDINDLITCVEARYCNVDTRTKAPRTSLTLVKG